MNAIPASRRARTAGVIGILSLLCARAGAETATGVDTSADAIAGARKAAELNGLSAEFVVADVDQGGDIFEQGFQSIGVEAGGFGGVAITP